MHKRLEESKHCLPPERSVPQNAALGCPAEGTFSGQFTDFCREEQHQVHGQGWEALETLALGRPVIALLQPLKNHLIPLYSALPLCFHMLLS